MPYFERLATVRLVLLAALSFYACGKHPDIRAQCETVQVGVTQAQLPFTVSTTGGGVCFNRPALTGASTAGPVDDLQCCGNHSAGQGDGVTCQVDCSQPAYQNFQWYSSAVQNSSGALDWCCLALQNGKVIARFEAFD